MLPLRQVLFIALLSLPTAIAALEIHPLAIQNQIPLVQIFGIPTAGSPLVLDQGRSSLSVREDITNNFAIHNKNGERITIDTESYRTTIGFTYGIGHGAELNWEIPFMGYSGGILDWFIADFHHAFGFGDGDRNEFPRDRVLIRYEKGDRELITLEKSSAGIGDVVIGGGFQLVGDMASPSAVTLRASVKLPTGSSKNLRGSGSTDFAVWLTGKHEFQSSFGTLGIFLSGGGIYLTKGEVLPEMQRQFAAFGSAGSGFSPVDWFAFKAQVNANSPLYKDSDLTELKAGFNQSLGFSFALPRGFQIDVAAVEDLIVLSASPDIIFHFAVRKIF